MDIKALITINPDILGGQPVFAGTRVPVESLFDHLEAGVALDEFLDDFPTVSRAQAVALLDAYKANLPIETPSLPEDFRFNPALDQQYDEQPLFKDKIDRANHILKTVGLPKAKPA